jgi:hypothetical protein
VLIVQFAIHQFLVGLREAITIWLLLIGIAVVALGCLLAPDRVRHRIAVRDRRRAERARRADSAGGADGAGREAAGGGGTRRERPAQRRRNRLVAEAADAARYAEEIAVAASRAAVTWHRRHDDWQAAQRTQEAAWRAFEAADRAHRRIAGAGAFPVPSTALTPSEFADRERYLHRLATQAYRRGELSVEQLGDALSHRNGWDPRRHPFEQEAIVRRAARLRLLRIYQTAAATERAAWDTAERAAAAKRSLDEEAFAAAQRARLLGTRLAAERPQRRPVVGPLRRPTLAIR